MRILIVDDHGPFRSSARALLEAAGLTVVGEAADAAGALVEERRLRPDVVLVDVQLPDHDGFWVAAAIGALPDPAAVVLVSSREAPDYGSRLDRGLCLGFMTKADLSPAALEQLVAPVR